MFIATVNAGAIPGSHWTQKSSVGGGRIIGEGCHFIDLVRFLAGCPAIKVQVSEPIEAGGAAVATHDTVTVTLTFEDGSVGTIHYLANGHKSFPKERIEVFAGGRVIQVDNFRKMSAYGWSSFKKLNLMVQDKGQNEATQAFVTAIRDGKSSPIPFEELIEVARLTLDVAASLGVKV